MTFELMAQQESAGSSDWYIHVWCRADGCTHSQGRVAACWAYAQTPEAVIKVIQPFIMDHLVRHGIPATAQQIDSGPSDATAATRLKTALSDNRVLSDAIRDATLVLSQTFFKLNPTGDLPYCNTATGQLAQCVESVVDEIQALIRERPVR